MSAEVNHPPLPVVTGTTNVNGFTVVACEGAIDVATCDQLRQAVNDALSTAPHLVVADLGAVDFTDSTALGVLVGATRRAHELGGSFRVVAPLGRPVARALHLLGLDRVVDRYETLDEATTAPTDQPSPDQ